MHDELLDYILEHAVPIKANGLDTGKQDCCWGWEGPHTSGHSLKSGRRPLIRVGAKERSAQRVIYELWHDIELGPRETVVMSCGNTECINPGHMEREVLAGVRAESPPKLVLAVLLKQSKTAPPPPPKQKVAKAPPTKTKRVITRTPVPAPKKAPKKATRQKTRATHCRKGHPYLPGSYTVGKNGKRSCRICRADQNRAYKELHGVPKRKLSGWREQAQAYLEGAVGVKNESG